MANLKILHLTDGGLDDQRIINAASTGKKSGFEVFFCGKRPQTNFTTNIFKDIQWLKISNRARVSELLLPVINQVWPLYPYPKHAFFLQKQIKSCAEKIKPDIIHAHNIFVAYHALNLGIPLVLDDHELYSVEIRAISQNSSWKKKSIAKIKEGLWKKWEIKIGEKHPIITVSKPIADHHKKYCKNVFVVPNYPRKDSIKMKIFNKATNGKLCSVYLGTDSEDANSIRNIRGLHEIFSSEKNVGCLKRIGVSSPNNSKIQSFGFIPMRETYKIMQTYCHIGILPWRHHWFHEYCCPNKVYEYAHNGLWLITIDDLTPVIDDFGKYCDKFDSYENLSSLLEFYNQNPDDLNKKRRAVLNFAKNNLVWEKNDDNILDAYKKT